MRYTVDPWAPEYGASVEGGLDALAEPDATVDVDVEVPSGEWRPLAVPSPPPSGTEVVFVDGVRRIDARLWFTGADGEVHTGLCASYAAGRVRCGARAEIERVAVERRLFAPAGLEALEPGRGLRYEVAVTASDELEVLVNELQHEMRGLEIRVAEEAEPADLTIVDGPLSSHGGPAAAVGYVKSHQVGYLPPRQRGVVERLGWGERTPLFVTQTSWSRYSWYLRLADAVAHPWAGVVRCEIPADLDLGEARARANLASAVLPTFASARHKDPRAPQNLYPIAGLERELRHHLGDRELVYRSLVAASA